MPDPIDVIDRLCHRGRRGVAGPVAGTIDGTPDQLADGLGVTVDDGSGPMRAVIGPDAAAGLDPRIWIAMWS